MKDLVNKICYVWRKKYRGFIFFLWIFGSIIFFSPQFLFEDLINFFYPIDNIKANDKLLGFIYYTTGIIILWYTRETYDLKVLTRKTLEHERKKFEIRTIEEVKIKTIERMDIFNRFIKNDCAYIISGYFEQDLAEKSVYIKNINYEENENHLRRLDNVLSFFETSALMAKVGLIDFELFCNHYSITMDKIFGNNLIKQIIENQKKNEPEAWSELIEMYAKFKKKK